MSCCCLYATLFRNRSNVELVVANVENTHEHDHSLDHNVKATISTWMFYSCILILDVFLPRCSAPAHSSNNNNDMWIMLILVGALVALIVIVVVIIVVTFVIARRRRKTAFDRL